MFAWENRYRTDHWTFCRFYSGFVLALFLNDFYKALLAIFVWYAFKSWFFLHVGQLPFIHDFVTTRRRSPDLDMHSHTIAKLVEEWAYYYDYVYASSLGMVSGLYLLHVGRYDDILAGFGAHWWPPNWFALSWIMQWVFLQLFIWHGGITSSSTKIVRVGHVLILVSHSVLIAVYMVWNGHTGREFEFFYWTWLVSMWFFWAWFFFPLVYFMENAVFASSAYFHILAWVFGDVAIQWALFGMDVLAVAMLLCLCCKHGTGPSSTTTLTSNTVSSLRRSSPIPLSIDGATVKLDPSPSMQNIVPDESE